MFGVPYVGWSPRPAKNGQPNTCTTCIPARKFGGLARKIPLIWAGPKTKEQILEKWDPISKRLVKVKCECVVVPVKTYEYIYNYTDTEPVGPGQIYFYVVFPGFPSARVSLFKIRIAFDDIPPTTAVQTLNVRIQFVKGDGSTYSSEIAIGYNYDIITQFDILGTLEDFTVDIPAINTPISLKFTVS